MCLSTSGHNCVAEGVGCGREEEGPTSAPSLPVWKQDLDTSVCFISQLQDLRPSVNQVLELPEQTDEFFMGNT